MRALWRRGAETARLSAFAGQVVQILVGASGGLAFHLLGLPAAWLSGSVIAAVIWNLAGFGRPLARPLADAAMLLSGASMGAGVTPEALAAVGRYPVSLVILAACVFAGTAASIEWLIRVCGWRRDDALLACAPGAFSTVLSIAIDRNAAVAEIAVVQSLRIFVLVALLPSTVAMIGGGAGGSMMSGRPVAGPATWRQFFSAGSCLPRSFEGYGWRRRCCWEPRSSARSPTRRTGRRASYLSRSRRWG